MSVLLLPLSVGAPGCPCRAPPPVPPYQDFTSPYNVDCPVRGWLFTALLPPPWRTPPGARGAAPALVEYVPPPPPPSPGVEPGLPVAPVRLWTGPREVLEMGGGRSGDSKVCVPKMVGPDFPNGKFRCPPTLGSSARLLPATPPLREGAMSLTCVGPALRRRCATARGLLGCPLVVWSAFRSPVRPWRMAEGGLLPPTAPRSHSLCTVHNSPVGPFSHATARPRPSERTPPYIRSMMGLSFGAT